MTGRYSFRLGKVNRTNLPLFPKGLSGYAVDAEAVETQSATFQEALDRIDVQVEAIKSDLGQRKLVGEVVSALLAVAGILLLMLRHTISRTKVLVGGYSAGIVDNQLHLNSRCCI